MSTFSSARARPGAPTTPGRPAVPAVDPASVDVAERLLAIVREHFPEAEDRATIRSVMRWRDEIDLESLEPTVRDAVRDAGDLMARALDLLIRGAEREAIGYVLEGAIRLLLMARSWHDPRYRVPGPPMPLNRYMRQHVDPYVRCGRQLHHRLRGDCSSRPRNKGRAPRPATSHRPGSRRASGIRSGTDPGDDDPGESAERLCLGCGEPLIGKRPQARYHGEACRKRYERTEPSPGRTCATCDAHLSVYNRGSECWSCAFEASLAVDVDAPCEPGEVFPWLTDAEFDARCEELSSAPILAVAP